MKHLKKTIVLLALLIGISAHADFLTVANPEGAGLSVLDGTTMYLSLDYYDWGPDWSGVNRKTSAVESVDTASFTLKNEIQKTKTPFTVEGHWKLNGQNSMRLDATLTPGGDSPLTLAQFGLNFGVAFEGGQMKVTSADGVTNMLALPLGRGTVGNSVTKLELTDKAGAKTVVTFDKPTPVTMDRQARFVIAQEKIVSGQPGSLAFTMEFPKKTAFVPGLTAAASLTDISSWYPFDATGPVPESSEWSLASWLDAPAGSQGRIHREGDKLVYHNKPIKLWGINNAYAACAPDKSLADKRADFYAAMGINAVRLHKYADGTGWAGILTQDSAVEFDPAKLDNLDYYVAALKKRGIFIKLSPVFIIDIGPGDRERVPYMDEFGEMKNNRLDPKHGSFYISTELQDLLIEQVTKFLNHTNPHTGLRYADDPAIAFVELYNEDSSLFGGVTRVMAQSATLRARAGAAFAGWLKNKYPTEEDFLAAWGPKALNNTIIKDGRLPMDESWAENRIYPAGNPWFFDPDNLESILAPNKRRLLDTMKFLYELQNQVYARYMKAIRDTGYKGELITSNWQAGRMMSHFYNLDSDVVGGTIDRHNYFGGGSGAFNSSSMLSEPGSGLLSSSLQQVEGYPFMLSEWIHTFPNEWGVEGPAILGAYGMGLQGWDVSFPFQNTDNGTFRTAIGSERWDVVAPNVIGLFPAVSRQVLRGDVKEAGVTHTRNVHVPSLDEGKVGFNEKARQQGDVKTFTSDVFPAEALAVARGTVKFTETFKPTEQFPVESHRKDGRLVSETGQLQWQPGTTPQDGFITINTPSTQAVVGFAEGQSIPLGDVIVKPKSRFGAIYLSARSPDGTLETDKGVLVTAIARARNKGSIVVKDSYLMSTGEIKNKRPVGPVVMEPVVVEIDLKRGGNPTVHILDHLGVKTGKTLPIADSRLLLDTGRDATPYYLIEYP